MDRRTRKEIKKLEHEIRQWKLTCILLLWFVAFIFVVIYAETSTPGASTSASVVMTEICRTV